VLTPVGSSASRRAIAAIDRLGDREIRATTQMAAAFADRPTRALREILADEGRLARDLHGLRAVAERATRPLPSENPQTSGRAHRGRDDRRDRTRDLRRDIERADAEIEQIVNAMEIDRQTLEQDNAALGQQERALWTQIKTLREYAVLAGRLDELLEARITEIEGRDRAHADALRAEALVAARRRRRDILLQLAVASQGYAALRLIEQDNLEVIWAIRSATTTSIAALRTAALALQAVESLGGRLDTATLADAWSSVVAAVDEVDARTKRTLDAVDASASVAPAS
jgi:uncharacterized protein YaaN involved in tellurite resistance